MFTINLKLYQLKFTEIKILSSWEDYFWTVLLKVPHNKKGVISDIFSPYNVVTIWSLWNLNSATMTKKFYG